MTVINNLRAVPAEELLETMTGSWVLLGTLVEPPTMIIFDNFSTVNVAISFDGGTTTWKTFAAGSALVLDSQAALSLFVKGLGIYGNGASGDFSVSYVYRKQ